MDFVLGVLLEDTGPPCVCMVMLLVLLRYGIDACRRDYPGLPYNLLVSYPPGGRLQHYLKLLESLPTALW